jgi:transcriptional regulator with XRE-family HTH domain
MVLAQRLIQLRHEKKLSQADVAQRSSFLPCYISRVENGYTVPNLFSLQRMANALEVPLYRLFYEGEVEPDLPKFKSTYPSEWGSSGPDAEFLRRFRAFLGKASPRNRKVLLAMASHMIRETEAPAAMKRHKQ